MLTKTEKKTQVENLKDEVQDITCKNRTKKKKQKLKQIFKKCESNKMLTSQEMYFRKLLEDVLH